MLDWFLEKNNCLYIIKDTISEFHECLFVENIDKNRIFINFFDV